MFNSNFAGNPTLFTPGEYEEACERGRRMAARAMISYPEARERTERMFGVEYCRQRYPEVYAGPLVVGYRRELIAGTGLPVLVRENG